MRMSRRGFTLIELLVVILLLGILASVAISRYGATSERAYDAAALSDLRNLSVAIERFHIQNDRFPQSLADTEFQPSDGVQVSQFDLGVQAGVESIDIRVEHQASSHYYQLRFPSESGPERLSK